MERPVLFVDMLGFSTMVLNESDDTIEQLASTLTPLDAMSRLSAALTTMQLGTLAQRFYRFHNELETAVSKYVPKKITAITFSDSAFISMPRMDSTCSFATELMRDLIIAEVPVRMGIGVGTFAALRFRSDNTTAAHVHTSQFLGSAVVHAHRAENSGSKAMTIRLHPTATAAVRSKTEFEAIRLDNTTPDADAELNYLGPVNDDDTTVDMLKRFDALVKSVDAMGKGVPADKKHYYTNTRNALKRMRDKLKLSPA